MKVALNSELKQREMAKELRAQKTLNNLVVRQNYVQRAKVWNMSFDLTFVVNKNFNGLD